MAKPQVTPPRIRKIQLAIIAFVATAAGLLAIYGMLYSTGITEGTFTEGEHYTRIDAGVRTHPGDPIEVIEFFSFGCIHCKNFDPLIEEWQSAQSPNEVSFRRQPVAFSPTWAILGQTFLALQDLGIEEQNHERIFRAIHDQGKQFLSVEMIADFIDGHGATSEEFLRSFNSPKVRRGAAEFESMQTRYAVQSVPTIAVAGKYMVKMEVGRKIALDVVDYLVALERKGVATPATK